MWYQIPLTNAPYQEQTFEFLGRKIKLTLRYNSIAQTWFMDIIEPIEQRVICQGLALISGVPLLNRTTQPYQLWLVEQSDLGLDPISLQDLATRFILYIEEKQ